MAGARLCTPRELWVHQERLSVLSFLGMSLESGTVLGISIEPPQKGDTRNSFADFLLGTHSPSGQVNTEITRDRSQTKNSGTHHLLQGSRSGRAGGMAGRHGGWPRAW